MWRNCKTGSWHLQTALQKGAKAGEGRGVAQGCQGCPVCLPARPWPWRGGGDGMQSGARPGWQRPRRGCRAQAAPRLRQLRPLPACAGAPRAACRGSRMWPVSLPPTRSDTFAGSCGFPEPSSPPLLPSPLGTVAVSEIWGEAGGSRRGLMVGTHWQLWGLLAGPHISAGLGLTGALWGAGAPQIALEGKPGCLREGHWRYHGGEGKVFLLALPRHASVGVRHRRLQRGLGGIPAALCGCVWSVVQSPGAVVSKPCSWQIFWELLPQAHESHRRSGLLVVQPWVRAGWTKVLCECRTLSGPSSQGDDLPLLISDLYFTEAPTLVGNSVSSMAEVLEALGAGLCRSNGELETPSPRCRSDAGGDGT